MNTYFIGAEETRAYAKDFLHRLERLESFPDIWCPITKSGDVIAKVMIDLVGVDRLSNVQLLPIHVERLDYRHKDRPTVKSGVESMDRPKWSDRLFQMRVSNACTYVLVRGETLLGYLTPSFRGGYDVHRRSSDRHQTEEARVRRRPHAFRRHSGSAGKLPDRGLNAIESEVGFYEKLEYKKVGASSAIPLDDETYWPMQRSVLYHQRAK